MKKLLNIEINTINLYKSSVFTKLLVVALSFINSIIINRYLGVELRGEYTTILNYASLLQLFLNLGIGNAYPALKRKNNDDAKTLIVSIIFIQMAIFLLISGILIKVVDVDIKYVILIAIVSSLENEVSFIALIENVLKKNIVLLINSIIYSSILLAIFFVSKGNLYLILLIEVISHVLISSSIIIKFKLYNINTCYINFKYMKKIFSLGIPIMLMNLLIFCNYHIDIIILNWFSIDYYWIGLYGTAVSLGNMLWIVPDAFKDILYFRSAKKDNIEEIIISITYNIFLCFGIIIGFIFLGKWFLTFMYGVEYANAYPLVLIIFFGTLPMIFYKLIHPIYISNGKLGVVVRILLVSVVINVIANLITIPIWGVTGAAISSVASYSICGIIFLMIFRKDYNVNIVNIVIKSKRQIK